MKRKEQIVPWSEAAPVLRKLLVAGFLLSVLWLTAIVAAPVLVAAKSRFLQMAGSAIYFFMDPVCHQLTDRCLFISGLPMPVCARCFSIYAAGTVVTGVAVAKKAFYLWPVRWYAFLAAGAAILIVPEKAGWVGDYVEARILAGVLLGVLIFRLILEAVVYGKRKRNG